MQNKLAELTKKVEACTRCPLCQEANPVPGLLNLNSKYFLIGEAPGKHEDEAGIPFVGPSGRRLDKLLELANIDINDCYLSNVCRCRPPTNRDPRKKEIASCVEFLWREIRLVKPQYVITLGSVPLSLFCPYGVRQMHGTMFEWELEDGTD